MKGRIEDATLHFFFSLDKIYFLSSRYLLDLYFSLFGILFE